MSDRIRYGTAGLEDQGALGPLLLETLGPVLERARARAADAGLPTVPVEEELMAADDFFFSSIDLMNCCVVARAGDRLVGAACVNPFVGALMYVAVRKEVRRRGIGRALVARALEELERRGVDHVRAEIPLDADCDDARAFFDAVGFSPLREVREAGRALEPAPTDENDEGEEEDDA